MSQGPKVICMVRIEDAHGEHWYYAGTEDQMTARDMALDRGYSESEVTAQSIPNKFGIQHGEWRQAAP